MGISSLDSHTATDWLNKRVHYIVSEDALSFFNLKIRRVVYIDSKNVEYPNADSIPFSLGALNKMQTFTIMSNIGAAIYMAGKKEKILYGFKVSRGLLKPAEKVIVNSPNVGIIQIGVGLFAPEITPNQTNPDALVNSLFRLGSLFHEARHSDGSGSSLGFAHSKCPKYHDYAGQLACDENLNGPYTLESLMMVEMAKSCAENCSETDKEMIKLRILDSSNRIIKSTHLDEISVDWPDQSESL